MAFFVFVKMGKAPLSRTLRERKKLLCVPSLIFYYIKQIDSMLPCICPVIDHRRRQNVVRTSVTHLAIASCATFCSYHILTSSVICYWTDARQHGIYLLNIITSLELLLSSLTTLSIKIKHFHALLLTPQFV